MYSRNYIKEETEAPRPPENYAGCALAEECPPEEAEGVSQSPWEEAPEEPKEERRGIPVFSDLFSGRGISGLFSKGGISSFIKGIGTEEILIIATAFFLLFSKDGDKECAIMLLLLLAL